MQNDLRKRLTAGTVASLIAVLISVAPVAAQEGANSNTGSADTDTTNQQAAETSQQTTGTDSAANPCATQTQDSSQADATDDPSTPEDSGTDTASASAQTPCPGTNRETAGPNFAEAVQIAPGTTHWYRFRYVYDEDIDDEPGQAVVSLKMNPVGCASFDVTTSGRLNFPFNEEGDPIGPVGRGTPAPILDGTTPSTLLWVGSGEFSETHFVIVRNRSNEPCTYTLSITGSPVVF